MKKVVIFIMVSSVNYLCAGVLPGDFNFKDADNYRMSFMQQFRDYEENKMIIEHDFQHELYVGDQLSEQAQELLKLNGVNKKNDQFIERIKLIIAYVYRILSMNN